MIIKDIGYIICESAIPGFTETNIVKEENGKVIGEGILQTANEKNRNGRFYSSDELFPQLTAPRTLELLEAGYLRAELGHPLSNELVRQQTIDDSRTCAQFLKLWTEGDNVWGRFRGTNNAFGQSFDMDLRDGCKPAWSLRALGTLVQTARGAEVHKLKLITWDQVIYPSHPHAYTQKLVTESANYAMENSIDADASKVVPFNEKQVLDFIKTESANHHFVKECTDFLPDSYKVLDNGAKISVTTPVGETVVINVESYIVDEIRNYASRIDYLRS